MKNKMALTASDASRIVAACAAEADRHGWAVSVAVVDDGGHVMSLVRFDGANYASTDVALLKAQTSGMYGVSTAAAEAWAVGRPTMLALPARLPFQGALPILHEGECLGAVGVAGGNPQDDEQVAAAGIAALACHSAPQVDPNASI